MKTFLHTILAASLFLASCDVPKLQRDEFVGKWVADEDGSVVYLFADSTCKVESTRYKSPLTLDYELFELNFTGKWRFEYCDLQGVYEIFILSDGDVYMDTKGRYGIFFALRVEGGNGWLHNRPPWVLYTFRDGNPESTHYILRKVE